MQSQNPHGSYRQHTVEFNHIVVAGRVGASEIIDHDAVTASYDSVTVLRLHIMVTG